MSPNAPCEVLVRRHEILRTCLREVDGVPKQMILPACPIKLRSIDLVDARCRRRHGARRGDCQRRRPSSPSTSVSRPLFRAGLLRLNPGRSTCCSPSMRQSPTAGRSVCWSQSSRRRRRRSRPAPPWQRRARAAGRRLRAVGAGAAGERRARAVPPILAAQAQGRDRHGRSGRPRTGRPPRRPRRHRLAAAAAGLSNAVDDFASRHSFTLYGLAVAALALLLHRVTGEAKVVIGSQVAHREEPAAELLAGPTVNSITLCLPVDSHASFSPSRAWRPTRCGRRSTTSDCPSRWPCGLPDGAGERLHAVNLVVHRSYSGTRNPSASRRAASASSRSRPSPRRAVDLNFFLIWRDEGWRMSCEADRDFYDSSTVQELLEGWRTCLEALVTSPDLRLADCSALPALPRGRDYVDRRSHRASRRMAIASPFLSTTRRGRSRASTKTATARR